MPPTPPQGMIPVVFGPEGARVLGAYHPAAFTPGDGARTCGVVLCNPVGWLAFACQRAYRVLADRLAARGFPVLRFDHPGTGDSGGSDLDPGRVRAWLDGIGHAVDQLKALSGARTVSLFGVHLGATLAAAAAAERRDASVTSLVLWTPLLSGKAHVRQVRAYRLLNFPGAPPDPSGLEEAAGFVLTAETVGELSRLELSGWAPPDGCRVLVLGQEAQTPEERLAARLAAEGRSVEWAAVDGYGAMMQEARKSVVPEAAFEKVVSWLGAVHPERAPGAPVPAPPPPAVLEADGVREEALFVGRDRRSFGILTTPARPPAAAAPVLVWLNPSADHRIGPSRLHVTLARHLAGLGFTSLRFDPPGVGDGADPEAVDRSHPYSAGRLADVRDVLAWLAEERAAGRFALVGICSGAFVAFHLGNEDPRVVAQVLINPQTFVWREGDSLDVAIRTRFDSNRSYQRKLLDPGTWKRVLRGEVNVRGVAGVVARRLTTRALRRVRQLLPERPGAPLDVARALRRALKRGVDVLFVMGEDDAGLDYLEGHIGKRGADLARHPRFRLEVVSGTDHAFSPYPAQVRLRELVAGHLAERFAPAAAPAAPERATAARSGRGRA